MQSALTAVGFPGGLAASRFGADNVTTAAVDFGGTAPRHLEGDENSNVTLTGLDEGLTYLHSRCCWEQTKQMRMSMAMFRKI